MLTTATTTIDDDDDGYFDDSNYSTAPSSPGHRTTANFFFYSAPTSPMHYVLSSSAASRSSLAPATSDVALSSSAVASFEFEFSSRVDSPAVAPELGSSMSSADELFLNGQIRPMKLSAHLNRPQLHDKTIDGDDGDDDDEEGKVRSSRDLRLLRNRSQHRRTRSLSPLRSTTPFDWLLPNSADVADFTPEMTSEERENNPEKIDNDAVFTPDMTSATSASSSRCSSAGRSSKRWLFLKDFLRSKSEGRSNNKFWHNINMSFSPAKEKDKKINGNIAAAKEAPANKTSAAKETPSKKTAAATAARKRRSAHEMHYAANRAQAEEMRKKTFLPYRQGLLGCLGFNSKSYGALNGFARALNPVSSR